MTVRTHPGLPWRLLATVAILGVMAVQSWFDHMDQLERRLALEATETVHMADALIYEIWRHEPMTSDRGHTGPAITDTLRGPEALPRNFAPALVARLRPPTGYSRLDGPDGRVLLVRGNPIGIPNLSAASASFGPSAGWIEGRSHSALTGLSSVSGVSFGGAVLLWAASIALPGLLLLSAGALISVVASRLEDARRKLRQASRHALQDALSGLPNRRAFTAAFHVMSRASVRDQRPLSALFIDIDQFKQFNDEQGHGAGDRALRAVAKAIRESLLRPTDFCCRWGGEEFVVLLPDTDDRGALQTAQRILDRVRDLRLRQADAGEQHITVSIGIASHPGGGGPAGPELALRADEAMLQAKRAGRNRWVVWRAPAAAEAAAAGEAADAAATAPVTRPPAPTGPAG